MPSDEVAQVEVFRRGNIWCFSVFSQQEHRFAAGALGISDDAADAIALETAREKFPDIGPVNIMRGTDFFFGVDPPEA